MDEKILNPPSDESVKDIRWRLEEALEKLDDSLWHTALEHIIEAGEVCQAMIERIKDYQRHQEAHVAREDYKDRYGEYPDMSEFC